MSTVQQTAGEQHVLLSPVSWATYEFPLEEVLRFLRASETQDETSLMRSFVAWVREHGRLASEAPQPGSPKK